MLLDKTWTVNALSCVFLTRCNVYRTSICAQLQQVLGVSVYVSRCGMRRGGEGSGGVAGGTYECKTLVPDSTLQTTFPPLRYMIIYS